MCDSALTLIGQQSTATPFSEGHLKTMENECKSSVAGTCSAQPDNSYCELDGYMASLAPPNCAGFTAHTGSIDLPFLTWNAAHYAESIGTGFLGGLGELADEAYTTWACVASASCAPTPNNARDTACFKYNHVSARPLTFPIISALHGDEWGHPPWTDHTVASSFVSPAPSPV